MKTIKAKCSCNHRGIIIKTILACLAAFLFTAFVCWNLMSKAEERELGLHRWRIKVAASVGSEEGVRLYQAKLMNTNLNITAWELWTNIVNRYNAMQPDDRLEYGPYHD
jgi:hypothetical protein